MFLSFTLVNLSFSRLRPRAAVIAALLIACFGPQGFAQVVPLEKGKTAPVNILVLTDLTQKDRDIGQQTSFGVKLVRAELKNARRELNVVIEDHRGQGDTAASLLRKHLRNSRVDAVYVDLIGPARAVSAMLADDPRLMIYVGRSFSVMKSNPYAFKTGVNIADGCRALALYYRKLKFDEVGLLQAVDEIGELCRSGVGPAYPDLRVARYSYGDSLYEHVMGFRRAGVKALLNATYEEDFEELLRTMGKTKTSFILGVNEDALSKKLFEQFGKQLDGLLTFGLPVVSPEFIDKVIAMGPDNSFQRIQRAALSYLHIRQLYDAISGCHYLGIDCQLRVLKGARPEPSVGFLGWSGWEERTASFQVMLKRWKDGKPSLVR